MNARDKKFMIMALKEAKTSLKRGGIPVGTVIAEKNKIIARTGRHRNDHAYLDHAEMRALRKAYEHFGKNEKGLTVYTTLEPCIMCFGTILHNRTGELVYALEDPFGGATRIKASMLPVRNKKFYPKITKGIFRKESAALFRDFLGKTKNPFWQNKKNPLVELVFSLT